MSDIDREHDVEEAAADIIEWLNEMMGGNRADMTADDIASIRVLRRSHDRDILIAGAVMAGFPKN